LLSLQTEQKKTIRSLNPLFMVGLFFLFLLLRTSCGALLPTMILKWDFLLPFMIYFGQRRPFFEGLLLWFIMSHWFSLESSAPMGTWVMFYLIIYVLSRLLSEVFFAVDSLQIFALLFIMLLASKFLLPWTSHFFGARWAVFSWNNLHPGFFMTDLFLSWITFLSLITVDVLTAKEARPILDLNEGVI